MSAPRGQALRTLTRAVTGRGMLHQRALARAALRRATGRAPAKAPAGRGEG